MLVEARQDAAPANPHVATARSNDAGGLNTVATVGPEACFPLARGTPTRPRAVRFPL